MTSNSIKRPSTSHNNEDNDNDEEANDDDAINKGVDCSSGQQRPLSQSTLSSDYFNNNNNNNNNTYLDNNNDERMEMITRLSPDHNNSSRYINDSIYNVPRVGKNVSTGTSSEYRYCCYNLYHYLYQYLSRLKILLFVIVLLALIIIVHYTLISINNHDKSQSCNNNNDDRTITCTATESSSSIMSIMEEKYMIQNVSNGVVASDHEICSRMAVQNILQQYNGNAIDATIFVALCLGIVNPASSGLGGGAFILIHHTPNYTNYDTDTDKTTSTTSSSSSPSPPYNDELLFHDARTFKPKIDPSNNEKVNEVIDCRERAPLLANTTMYQNVPSNASVYGTMAIPIMGELHCLYVAHVRFGSLHWSTIIQPIIDMALNGVTIGSYLAKQIHDTAIHHKKLQESDPMHYNQYNEYNSLRSLLTHNDNWDTPLRQGDILRNIELGQYTLPLIAQHGIKALYQPPIAATLANEIQELGPYGIVQAQDYMNYRPTIHTPLFVHHVHGYTIMGVPPPSSGGAVILGAIRFLSNFTIPLVTYHDTLSVHRIVEACKHVFAMRMSLSDPDYNTNIVQDVVSDLIHTNYMDQLRSQHYNNDMTLAISNYGGTKWSLLNDTDIEPHQNITDAKEGDRQNKYYNYNRHQRRQQNRQTMEQSFTHNEQKLKDRPQQKKQEELKEYYRKLQRSFGYLNDHGTSHFSVIDKNGNAVAMTTSINTNFGSHIRSPTTGIIFSNTMDDFSKPDMPNHYGLKPSKSNYIQPNKRPLSSMSPTMVFREMNHNTHDSTASLLGELVLIIGASGGPKIITAVLQVLLRFIFMGQNLLDSILHPRIHDQLIYHGGAITATEKATLVSSTSSSSSSSPTTSQSTNDKESIPFEWNIDVSQRTRDALIRRHHNLIDIDFSGTVQAIGIDYESDGNQPKYIGVSDPRKDGSPFGY